MQAFKEPSASLRNSTTQENHLFLNQEIADIFYNNADAFAEIFCRDNIFTVVRTPDGEIVTGNWSCEYWPDYVRGYFDQTQEYGAEVEYFGIKQKGNFMFPENEKFELYLFDRSSGLVHGDDVVLYGWTQQDIDDFNNLFWSSYQTKK